MGTGAAWIHTRFGYGARVLQKFDLPSYKEGTYLRSRDQHTDWSGPSKGVPSADGHGKERHGGIPGDGG